MLCTTLCTTVSVAHAAEYPERPMRVVVEFPAGGATDVVARRVGNKLRERIGQQIIIDNRPGAGGLIAHEFVAKSPADGYTLLMASRCRACVAGRARRIYPYQNRLTSMPHIKTGKLRALGVTTAERMVQARDIPTVAEQGYAGYAAAIWAGLMAPKNTPGAVVTKLEANVVASVKDREVNAQLINDGMRPLGGSAADLGKLLGSELALWEKVIRDIGIKPAE